MRRAGVAVCGLLVHVQIHKIAQAAYIDNAFPGKLPAFTYRGGDTAVGLAHQRKKIKPNILTMFYVHFTGILMFFCSVQLLEALQSTTFRKPSPLELLSSNYHKPQQMSP